MCHGVVMEVGWIDDGDMEVRVYVCMCVFVRVRVCIYM